MYSYAGYSIKKSIELLNNYKKNLTEKTDINKIKLRLETEIYSMNKMANELVTILEYTPTYISQLQKKISRDMRAIDEIIDYQEAITMINSYQGYVGDEITNIKPYAFIRKVNELAIGMFNESEELTPNDCRTIMDSIVANRNFNIFSTRAKNGYTLKELKELSQGKATAYGLEESDALFNSAKANCDRVIKGTLFGSRISNDVFDVMYLTPKISWNYSFTETGSLAEKSEKHMLRNSIKHLRKDGLFIYCIPYFRLTKDISLLISKLLDNVQVIRRRDSDYKQIIILGTKNITRDSKEEVYRYLCELEYMNIDYFIENKYTLPSGGLKQPELFRGSVLDEDEIRGLIANSGLMNSFWKKNEIQNDKQSTRPLMPFNMGQIGLVLTSGCLDGTVKEFDGQYHAIKGMVTKIRHTDTNSDALSNEETSIETISNKVQINIMTPDGEFIELA